MKWYVPRWLHKCFPQAPALPVEIQQARALIAALDKGGVPLNPAKINQIARNLGLEVSNSAPMEHTIHRIRAALLRDASNQKAS